MIPNHRIDHKSKTLKYVTIQDYIVNSKIRI